MATVRRYTVTEPVTKRVVTIELDEKEAMRIANDEVAHILVVSRVMAAIRDAFNADRASDAKEDEDVPF